MATIGKNILDNLTTGMYSDSRVIYREYIQNACDQIDKAYNIGLLKPNEGRIDIWLDAEKRTVSIEDNATGIGAADFERTLADIANSDKKLGEDKGFRGIGRLCGLAYCKELIFTSTAVGEDVISVMRCDALKMRELINASENGKKYTAGEVLRNIYVFDSYKTAEKDSHWFKVEMVGINDENTDLLDFAQIKEYLSFVAPVPYQNTFIFRKEVGNYAKKIGYHIDEYMIALNGEPIFKKYTTNFKTSKGEDEVFAVSKDLIPNSQRDYFNENATRVEFEREMRRYFNSELSKIYYEGSAINSAYSKIDSYEKKQVELQEKRAHGDFIDTSHLENALEEVKKAEEAAQKAADELEKKKQKAENNPDSVVSQVIKRIEKERQHPVEKRKQIQNVQQHSLEQRRVDRLSAYNKRDRKLISKIFGIIVKSTDEKTAEMIIKKIEGELQ
mgnify:CR=1 FL=1